MKTTKEDYIHKYQDFTNQIQHMEAELDVVVQERDAYLKACMLEFGSGPYDMGGPKYIFLSKTKTAFVSDPRGPHKGAKHKEQAA